MPQRAYLGPQTLIFSGFEGSADEFFRQFYAQGESSSLSGKRHVIEAIDHVLFMCQSRVRKTPRVLVQPRGMNKDGRAVLTDEWKIQIQFFEGWKNQFWVFYCILSWVFEKMLSGVQSIFPFYIDTWSSIYIEQCRQQHGIIYSSFSCACNLKTISYVCVTKEKTHFWKTVHFFRSKNVGKIALAVANIGCALFHRDQVGISSSVITHFFPPPFILISNAPFLIR